MVNTDDAGKMRGVGCLWFITLGTAVVAIISLLINVALVWALLERRAALQVAVDQSIAALDNATRNPLQFNFPISQTVDFEGDIPIQQNLDFPLATEVRVNTLLQVPVELPLVGRQVVEVPVDTSVPISAVIPIQIDQTVHIKTRVPVRMNIPIEISPQQPPLHEWIGTLRNWLERLRDQL